MPRAVTASLAPRLGSVGRWPAALIAVALPRLALFPFARNFYGDPVGRLAVVAHWLDHPVFLRSYLGARQFGPLHLYLIAGALRLYPDLDVAPRAVSLLCGVLTALPLYRLTERRFGKAAALAAVLGLAVYPLHLQASTTAVSEAVFLLFLLAGLDTLDTAVAAGGRPGWFLAAGLCFAAAEAVRYDGWLYAPLAAAWLWRPLRAQRLASSWALIFLGVCGSVPLLLLWGNGVDLGDPLYVIHAIDADHAANARHAAMAMGRLGYAVYCLAFWPANLAWELTPPFALGLAFGLIAGLRGQLPEAASGRPERFDLAVLAALPALYFSLAGACWLGFHPLARFTLPTAVLLLPYAGAGVVAIGQRWPSRWQPLAVALAAAAAVGLPSYLAARTLGHGDWFADTLRPVSPLSNLPPDLEAAVEWIAARGGGRRVTVETNWLYEELPLVFYARLAGAEVFTPREGPAPAGFEPPDLLVVPQAADILVQEGFQSGGGRIWRAGAGYETLARLGRLTIYQRTESAQLTSPGARW